ncbi:23S rRNA (adenine(2030)-N(6))-methyltransferase RlmJ [Kushneria aurantia]|uniref:Ribosomal RNA large subunit methyltransferase J n=1 Tax=Kushneria aurantia TaxID=504092 RepID=A0ABV6G0J1_9GAMM|nr:23S rRNA (adenine(2030)-N(6))-methyltransferase RlmJ [Kushneria aurantia]
MLSYQHVWHAGNFADVHKHLALFALLERLMEKSSAMTLFDTHAGRGRYPLDEPETARLGEYRDGVLPLWQADRLDNGLLARFRGVLDEVQRSPGGAQPDHYPGSPWWFARCLRRGDSLRLFELHPGEHRHLEEAELGRGRVQRRQGDGLAGFADALPVATPRLAALIDPSWEVKGEFAQVAKSLAQVMKKVRHAVVLIWYPLLADHRHQPLLDGIRKQGIRNVWRSELTRFAPGSVRGLYGSGLLLLNPPWQLDLHLDEALTELARLYGGAATHESGWWVAE